VKRCGFPLFLLVSVLDQTHTRERVMRSIPDEARHGAKGQWHARHPPPAAAQFREVGQRNGRVCQVIEKLVIYKPRVQCQFLRGALG
jgi:hypothetical protein